MKLKDLGKLLQTRSYSWLMKCAKPFRWLIITVTLLSVTISMLNVGSAVLSKQMVDYAVGGKSSQAILFIILFIASQLGILSLNALSSMIVTQLYEKISYRTEQNVLKRIYASTWMSISKYHSGDVLTRITSDIENIANLWVSTIPGIIALGLQFILAFTVLLNYDATLAMFAFLLGPISIIISFLLGLRLKSLQHGIQAAESRHRAYLTELIQHMMIIKSFQHEKESLRKVIQRQNDKFGWVVRKNRLGIAANFVLSFGYWIGYVIAFIYGVFKLAGKTVTFGTFTAFLQLIGQIQLPFVEIAKSIPQMVSSFASVERIMELEALEHENIHSETNTENEEAVGLEIKNLSFGYNPGEPILKDISLGFDAGKIIALIGSSGEGKTTFMRLLLGLLEPGKGTMYLSSNKQGLVPVSASTRNFFTYVPQGNTLFSGTIEENLRIGNDCSTPDEIEAALRASCAWEFVQDLSDKLNTVIGEDGMGLSEGQAQRLCIARALLRQSPVLLLDEATSALDMDTEKIIFENIKRLEPARTCIVITHRLSVLPLCEKVYRLEKGRLYMHETDEFDKILASEGKP
jgi:ATP-binding cassette subfamily B protein